MSKYQRTKFNKDNDLLANSKNYLDQNNIQDNILFSKTSSSLENKRKQNSLKNKLNSNLVMDSGLNKKSNLIGLNSITNPIHSELNEPLTEIELDNDDNSTTIHHHLDLLSNNSNQRILAAHDQPDRLINNNYNDKTNSNQNQHELSSMKRMLVSLDTNLENNSNLNRSYIYSTNTLTENSNQQDQQQSSPNHLNDNQRSLGLMNAVHLNNCSNGFQASPNVSFFGLQTSTIDPSSGNTIFGNFGKFKSNARFSTFFRQLKFIWRRATMLERLLTLFLLLLLFTICYLSFTVLTLKQLNKKLDKELEKRKFFLIDFLFFFSLFKW